MSMLYTENTHEWQQDCSTVVLNEIDMPLPAFNKRKTNSKVFLVSRYFRRLFEQSQHTKKCTYLVIPPMRRLAKFLGVNISQIQHALEDLSTKGYAYRIDMNTSYVRIWDPLTEEFETDTTPQIWNYLTHYITKPGTPYSPATNRVNAIPKL